MSPDLRVAVFTDNDFQKVNGVTTTLTALLACAPPGIRARVYTASATGADEPGYFAVKAAGFPIPFYNTMRLYVPPVHRLLEQVRADRADVVHVTTPGPVGLVGLRAAARLGVPVVGSFHTDLTAYTRLLSGSSHLAQVMRHYMRWVYGHCRAVLVPSDATRQLLIGDGLEPDRLLSWTRGVDTDLFTPSRRSEALRGEWAVSDRRPALLFVGRLSKEKGLAILPRVSDRLLSIGVRHRWVFVGDGPYRRTLQRDMPDACFMGELSRLDTARAFASADLFVFPSRTDTAGNVVLEAQASGLPVVVSEAGGPRENMVDGQTGLVCEGTSAHDWTRTIAALLLDPSRHARTSRAAMDYARTRSWPASLAPLYRAYLDAYRTQAAASSPGAVLPAHHAGGHP